MSRPFSLSFFLTLLISISFFSAKSVLADTAEPVLGTWIGFDNNNFPGQLRSVELDLQIDDRADAWEMPPDQDSSLATESETIYLTGRMTTTYLEGRPNNLRFVDEVFNVQAGYLPSLNVLILLPYRESGPGSSDQQLAVLSTDGGSLAFIQTPRSSGWPLPWLLTRRNQSDPVLNELAAMKQAGAFGGAGINTLSVTLQNLKSRMTQQQIGEQQQSIDVFRQRLVEAVLSRNLAAITQLNAEANAQAKALAQVIIFSGGSAVVPVDSEPGEQSCPESVLGWFEAVKSRRESERFDSFLEVFNAFRPAVFTPHFGKDFLAMSEAERTSLFHQMSRYCSRNARVPRSRFYQSFQYALWGGLATSTNNAGPFTAATGVRALEIFDAWQQEVLSRARANGSREQAERLGRALKAFSGSFWEAKAADITNTADQLVGLYSGGRQPSVALAAATPAAPRAPIGDGSHQGARSESSGNPLNKRVDPPRLNAPVASHARPELVRAEDRVQRTSYQPGNVKADGDSSNSQKIDWLKMDAKRIRLNDSLCILSGCEERCRESPDICPGGESAAMARGAWANCSGGDWSSENCQIIISRFGQHSQSTPVVVPEAYQSLYALLQSGQAFPLTESNLAFVAGLGGYLTNACQILGPEDAQVVNSFAQAGNTFAAMGNNYMNPGSNFETATSATLTVKAGIELGQNIACRLPEAYVLAKRIVASIKASDGAADDESSLFVTSCSRTFSEAQCQCLADLGRATIPDIHTRSYHRNMIREIIERNPMLGFAIGLQCRISNY